MKPTVALVILELAPIVVRQVSSTRDTTVVTIAYEEEEEVEMFHFCKAKGVVLASEKIFFLEAQKNRVTFWVLGEKERDFSSGCAIFFPNKARRFETKSG